LISWSSISFPDKDGCFAESLCDFGVISKLICSVGQSESDSFGTAPGSLSTLYLDRFSNTFYPGSTSSVSVSISFADYSGNWNDLLESGLLAHNSVGTGKIQTVLSSFGVDYVTESGDWDVFLEGTDKSWSLHNSYWSWNSIRLESFGKTLWDADGSWKVQNVTLSIIVQSHWKAFLNSDWCWNLVDEFPLSIRRLQSDGETLGYSEDRTTLNYPGNLGKFLNQTLLSVSRIYSQISISS